MENSVIGAIERVCRDLGLPPGDSYTQDWVYELPEEYRTSEFFSKYAAAYLMPEYGSAEKRLLMQLMLDVTNDLLQRDEAAGHQAWNSLVHFLNLDLELHRDKLEYWSLPGEPLEDAFRLTPLIRSFRHELSREGSAGDKGCWNCAPSPKTSEP
jgi:hypothetical protein